MIVGVPREIKNNEYRVGLVPAGVHAFVERGHKVLIEAGAGLGSGIPDEDYEAAGGKLVAGAAEVYGQADMIVKVKEPLKQEYKLIRKGQIVYTYFHFAAAEELTLAMRDSGAICIAYETMSPDGRSLPCLTPMSEVAGRMSIQEGAKYLERPMEGRGILLGGVPGVHPGDVVIIGAGIVGTSAAKVAAGIGANVTVLDVNLDRLRYLDDVMPANVTTIYSNTFNIRKALERADLVVGAVLVAGAVAPKLVRREDLTRMQQGAVVVDVAVDQGGCFETTKPTTHADPTYIVEGVVHYCVANMPGAVGRTSTFALTNVTTPYGVEIATRGWKEAAQKNPAIRTGLNMVGGKCVYKAVAESFKGLQYTPVEDVLK
ncbi:MAG: alanine dehydrogenase [Planctomycetaceae bacterium]|nr:alanine dehydrogenase [Planctomycetaceae bacterium]